MVDSGSDVWCKRRVWRKRNLKITLSRVRSQLSRQEPNFNALQTSFKLKGNPMLQVMLDAKADAEVEAGALRESVLEYIS